MTSHQLAGLLDHIRLGFGDHLKTATSSEFGEVVAAFRALPDQPLKELFKKLRSASAEPPQTGSKSATGPIPLDVPGTIERIRAIRSGTLSDAENVELGRLTAPQLKEVLRAFQQPLTGAKDALAARVRQLCRLVPSPSGSPLVVGAEPLPLPPAGVPDLALAEEGTRIYTELRDNRTLSISDVRAGFEPLRGYPKPVVEEIVRRLKHIPHGSRAEMLDRLLWNLEGIKMSQYRMEQIRTGT